MVDSPEPEDGAEKPAEALEVESQDKTPEPADKKADEPAAASPAKDPAAHKAKPQKAGAVARSSKAKATKPARPATSTKARKTDPAPKAPAAPVKAAPRKTAAVRAGSGGKSGGKGNDMPAPREPRITRSKSDQPTPSVKELKEKIMATNANDYPETTAPGMNATVADLQERSKAAYDKSTEMVSEMSDFAKGTAEAVVESTKIMAGAMQDMGRTYADEAKSAYEQMTADLKEMAGVKSPTELFQLQGKIMRRNFDALVSTTSKNAEMLMKLSNEAFAPLSERMNVAADKIGKVG